MDLTQMTLTALPGIPLVRPGDDLTGLILQGLTRGSLTLADGDILVVAQKIVSKAEGRIVRLADGKIVSDEPVLNQRRAAPRVEAEAPDEAEPAVVEDELAVPV